MFDEIKLFPYQKIGAEWLANRRLAYLADDMGVGKTAQAIRAADMIEARNLIVICPAIARPNWLNEFTKFSNLHRNYEVIEKKTDVLPDDRAIIISYDLLTECRDTGGRRDLLIGDEWHFLKSITSERSRAVLGSNGLIHKCARTWALSGTPAPNHYGELWLTMFLFGATKLTYDQFLTRYCITQQGDYGLKILGARTENQSELKSILGGIMLRRKKEDVLTDLPPLIYTDVDIDAGEVDLEINNNFTDWIVPVDRRDELRAKLEREISLLETAYPANLQYNEGAMSLLEASANSVATLRRYTGLQKVQAATDIIIEELKNNAYEKIVIFAIHQNVIERVREKLDKFGALTLYGKTPPEKREKNIKLFQNSPKHRVLICNVQAAGTAITLTSAHHVSFIEFDWVPGNNAQAIMRCHRIGQTKPVTARFFSLKNSLDKRITLAIRRKTRDITAIFDD